MLRYPDVMYQKHRRLKSHTTQRCDYVDRRGHRLDSTITETFLNKQKKEKLEIFKGSLLRLQPDTHQ